MIVPYYSVNQFFKEKFNGEKVWKIPINAGFSCPNKDGKFSKNGCIYCDVYSSGPIKTFNLSIEEQIENFVQSRKEKKFIAYYQANSNTYAPVDELKRKYDIIFKYDNIKGLFIGTRPDAIADEVYPILEDLNKKTYLCVELGLESIHQKSLDFLNRNHTYLDFLKTFNKLKLLNIDVVIHLIIGIPGESREDMLKSVEEINRIKPKGVKFHMLHILKDTKLESLYRQGQIKLLNIEEYTDIIVFLLERLDKDIVVHRLTGERDKEIFVAPLWALDKNKTIQRIQKKMIQVKTKQGKLVNYKN